MKDNEQVESKVPSQPNPEVDEASMLLKLKKENEEQKAKIDQLTEAKRSFYDTVLNNGTETVEDKPQIDIEATRKKLFSGDLNNLQYIQTALELRKGLMEEGKPDPFLPSGKMISPTEADIDTANRVADGLQELVDASNGNADAFRALYQSRVIDDASALMYLHNRK